MPTAAGRVARRSDQVAQLVIQPAHRLISINEARPKNISPGLTGRRPSAVGIRHTRGDRRDTCEMVEEANQRIVLCGVGHLLSADLASVCADQIMETKAARLLLL